MLTPDIFLQVIAESCATDQITLSSSMEDLDKVSGDETAQLMTEVIDCVLGISALDYDEHPVLEQAWHEIPDWEWTTVQQFYDYVAEAIDKHLMSV